jgi:hypothetical protein
MLTVHNILIIFGAEASGLTMLCVNLDRLVAVIKPVVSFSMRDLFAWQLETFIWTDSFTVLLLI